MASTSSSKDKNKPKRFVKSETTGEGQEDVHYLPFKVDYQGPAKVKTLFTKKSKPHPDLPNVSINHFRGRPLVGTKISLNKNKKKKEDDEDEYVFCMGSEEFEEEDFTDLFNQVHEPIVKISEPFKEVTTWEWDKPPSSMDSIVKVQDWLKLSNIIHDPIPVPTASQQKED